MRVKTVCVFLSFVFPSVAHLDNNVFNKREEFSDILCKEAELDLGVQKTEVRCAAACTTSTSCKSFFYHKLEKFCKGSQLIFTNSDGCEFVPETNYYQSSATTTATPTTPITTAATTTTAEATTKTAATATTTTIAATTKPTTTLATTTTAEATTITSKATTKTKSSASATTTNPTTTAAATTTTAQVTTTATTTTTEATTPTAAATTTTAEATTTAAATTTTKPPTTTTAAAITTMTTKAAAAPTTTTRVTAATAAVSTSGEYGSSCGSDADCSVVNSKCLDGFCLCVAGYRYHSKSGVCGAYCTKYGNTYIEYRDMGLFASTVIGEYENIDLVFCKDACSALSTCLGFNYRASHNRCKLKDGSPLDHPTEFRSEPGLSYFTRNCN